MIRTCDPQIRNLNWPSGFFYLFKLSYDSITACFRVFIAYAIQSISNFKKLGRAFTIVVLEGYGAKKKFVYFVVNFYIFFISKIGFNINYIIKR